ncbi:MAG TPA: sigma-70 family RNA polymerase sigma factor, partial [Candidatus Eisenbacteria bacterium]|nr:sigma-70 family RNA polymerase sigma factor [Candidatus Eisenbacteria bacterium]
MPDPDVAVARETAHRQEWGRVLAAVARVLDGDVGAAEECTQEAFLAAMGAWETHGVPRSPGAWLTTVARNRALDRIRRDRRLAALLPELARAGPATPAEEQEDEVVPDDRLRLVFTCCHPALASEARVALTLRLVCGVSTADIARAFLVPEPTMAARLTRAKKKITAARVPYRVPGADELPERLDSALAVVHLVFTVGHTSGGPALVRVDLVERALDLGRVLARLLPEEPEALGLLALLELTDARRPARVDADGELVLLEDQDRSLWDRGALTRGDALLDRALDLVGPARPPGRFVLQAAIAGVHADARSWEATDWPALVALYDRLAATWPSPVVAVNRAVALAFADGPG